MQYGGFQMWVVQLVGDSSDLADLAESLTDTNITVSYYGQDYIRNPDRCTACDEANAVNKQAEGRSLFLIASLALRWIQLKHTRQRLFSINYGQKMSP
jgi:hypothetical protein